MDEIEKKKLISREIARLKRIYADLEPPKKVLALKLIENAAFLALSMEELNEKMLDVDNLVETYQHGASQSGKKPSTYLAVYESILKSYGDIIAQLDKMLPRPKPVAKKTGESNDELEAFINSR